ncbi:hypothetical protein [Sphingomonas sanxanigenens]|uniref:Uncharacterized protein n=1 Tax=Sphingomonas sanxanigenens DSM 19645 = NX02 TaxID=1123269 RepID=W0AF02_9SPHN|nr:hypothetical protein [Sphingomonas sanxanigenens]AHE56469.1 hypothetical protein NX02_24310 [Sphingomonas sanxanigenens DSM 19645 = NX02]
MDDATATKPFATDPVAEPPAAAITQFETAAAAAVEAAEVRARFHHEGREDGWTPEKIRIFLHTLAETGVVEDAAAAAGISRQSAYRLRNSERGRAFRFAWGVACRCARNRLADDVYRRAVYGSVETIRRGDEIIQRHRHDDRLAMAVLARLDRLERDGMKERDAGEIVAESFDTFVDLVAQGGAGPANFIENNYKGGYDRRTPTTVLIDAINKIAGVRRRNRF